MKKEEILTEGHWKKEEFIQRVTESQWRSLLLSYNDKIIFNGKVRRLVAKPIGCGVYEISKKPRKEEETETSATLTYIEKAM